MVAVRRDEPCLEVLTKGSLLPWPKPTHAEHPTNGLRRRLSVKEWLRSLGHQPLDARSKEATAVVAHCTTYRGTGRSVTFESAIFHPTPVGSP